MRSLQILSCMSVACRFSLSFTTVPQTATYFRQRIRLQDSADSEPDLFDYFDPLLSPHAYPDGISPDKQPQPQAPSPPKAKLPNPFGIDYLSRKEEQEEQPTAQVTQKAESPTKSSDGSEPDLFEYFDPLLSPHAYPNGIEPSAASSSSKTKPLEVVEAENRYNPLKLNVGVTNASQAANQAPISTTVVPSGRKKIGILLMDHGSRNPKSNSRLEHLARLYQLSVDETLDGTSPVIVVEAAHMEIAAPSIPDGLKALLQQGVDEIVCHPYFLSPGRHVVEDIPEIVNQAIQDLQITVPITTTDPVGSNTQLMIGAIHSLVREESQLFRGAQSKN